MNRLFGASASKKPKPTLQDAISAVSTPPVPFSLKLIMALGYNRQTRVPPQ
jgi:hypothetical protein